MPKAKTKVVYVRVKLTVDAKLKVDEAISEMDYSFTYPGILDSEIVGCPNIEY